jgi:hypothetical protein
VAKRPGEALTPVERRLAAQLAAQAGLVLHNAGLADQLEERLAELRASRKRIVAAADGERRRLERNIHDGAQQQLVALSVLARLAETSVDSDKEGARRCSSKPRRMQPTRWRPSTTSLAGSTHRCWRTRDWRRRWRHRPASPRSPSRWKRTG